MIAHALLALQASGPQLATGAFLHYPYLQIGRNPAVTNSLSLMWHGVPEKATWKVRYAANTGDRDANVEQLEIRTSDAPFLSYRAELTGLKPSMDFKYEVYKDGRKVFESKAKAPVAGNSWRLVAFGDCGRGTDEQAKVSFQASKVNPNAVLLTGDIVYDRGRVSEYETRFWNYYNGNTTSPERGSQMMRSVPFFPVMGNHDMGAYDLSAYPDGLAYFYFYRVPLNGPKLPSSSSNTPGAKGKGLENFLAAAGDNYPQAANYSFDYGNAHFVVLDSNPNVNWATKELRQWLAEDLSKADPAKWRIVSYHHPEFQSSTAHADNKWMRLLSDLFVKHKVDLVLNGHVHNYQRSKPILESFRPLLSKRLNTNDWPVDKAFDGKAVTSTEGLIRIVTGGGGGPLYNPELEATRDKWLPFTETYQVKHSFSSVDFKGDTLIFKQIDLDGNVLDQFLLSRKPKS